MRIWTNNAFGLLIFAGSKADLYQFVSRKNFSKGLLGASVVSLDFPLLLVLYFIYDSAVCKAGKELKQLHTEQRKCAIEPYY